MENQSLTGQIDKAVVQPVHFLWPKDLPVNLYLRVLNDVLPLIFRFWHLVGFFCHDFFPSCKPVSTFHKINFHRLSLRNSFGPALKFRFSGVKRRKTVQDTKWILFQSTSKNLNVACSWIQCLKCVAGTSISWKVEKYIKYINI